MEKVKLTFGYLKLIKKVKQVNRKAALYLLQEAPYSCDHFRPSKKLTAVMSWGETPQGFSFWSDMEISIGQG